MSDIVSTLGRALGDSVLAGPAIPERNCTDWVAGAPARPAALVRPRTTEEVAIVLRLAHAAGVPVVAQGGLTGLCGGAEPRPGWVALSLERLVGVEEIDGATATLTVRAGTTLQAVQEAAAEAGFFYPVDLGARGSAAIGGTIATNAGGNRVIRYGMTRQQVLGLEVVLPDGTVLDGLNRFMKNNTGYDLKQLFIGSEGTLGVITRAVLKLEPAPGFTGAAVCGLAGYPQVLALLQAARQRLGGGLSAFEVMWPKFYDLMVDKASSVREPLTARHGIYVLVEAQGTDEAFDAPRFDAFLEGALEGGILVDAAVARSRADVQAFWQLRDSVAEFDHILGANTSLDVSLRTGEMDGFVAEAEGALAAAFPGSTTLAFGHIGDGNLHLVTHVPGLARQPKAEVQGLVYDLVRARAGSISAEHGIGSARSAFLGHSRKPAEIALMRTLKAALDPAGLLNPGKVLAEPSA